MKKFSLSFMFLIACVLSVNAEVANYLVVMFYGNDSEQLLSTIRIDESLKPHVEKQILVLECENFKATCDLETQDAWAFTDDDMKIIAISEQLPYGKEVSWFTLKEKDGTLTAETDGREIYVSTFKNAEEQYPEKEFKLGNNQNYIFNFNGDKGKIGFESTTFEVTRTK